MLTLICGLPNSGKTTYSGNYENVIHFDGVQHVTLDEHYINCHKMVSEAQGDVCVEGVYGSPERRRQLLAAARNQDKKVCVLITTPYEVCISRKSKPKFIVDMCRGGFKKPTLDEGWDEIIEVDCS